MTEYELNQNIDDFLKLPEVFQYYGIEIKYNGFCCCPFHGEKTPSCKVNDRVYHCFGCDARGNAISFVENMFNVDFKTAVQKLNADFGLGALETELTPAQQQKINQHKKEVFKAKQEEKYSKEIYDRYMEAWKHYIWYKPVEPPHFTIDSPQYEVDTWFNNVDKRFIEAQQTISELSLYAEIHGFAIEEFEAEQLARSRKPNEHDIACAEIAKLAYEANKKWQESQRLSQM